jgi:hypothetical protein
VHFDAKTQVQFPSFGRNIFLEAKRRNARELSLLDPLGLPTPVIATVESTLLTVDSDVIRQQTQGETWAGPNPATSIYNATNSLARF